MSDYILEQILYEVKKAREIIETKSFSSKEDIKFYITTTLLIILIVLLIGKWLTTGIELRRGVEHADPEDHAPEEEPFLPPGFQQLPEEV